MSYLFDFGGANTSAKIIDFISSSFELGITLFTSGLAA